MLNPLPPLRETPSQTAGPYLHIGLTPSLERITGPNVPDLGSGAIEAGFGPRIAVGGTLLDGSGAPVGDAVLELWQADADGRYRNGWARMATDGQGAFSFDTVRPGRVLGPDGTPMAPHVSLWIVARGINIGLQTRIYFEDESEANASDYILTRIRDARRRRTLIATRSETNGMVTYHLVIRLQGEDETVFFDF